MAHFSSGTEGLDYQTRYCKHCVHDIDEDCPVFLAHLRHNGDKGDAGNILELLIPKEGLGNGVCRMFVEKPKPNIYNGAEISQTLAMLRQLVDMANLGYIDQHYSTPLLMASDAVGEFINSGFPKSAPDNEFVPFPDDYAAFEAIEATVDAMDDPLKKLEFVSGIIAELERYRDESLLWDTKEVMPAN